MSVVCEASGIFGQQYVKSMVWEVSELCIRSVVCRVSGMWGSVVCGGKWYVVSGMFEVSGIIHVSGV